MNQEMKIFENSAFGKVRVQMVNEVPMFCAFDIASALGYKDPKQAVVTHCKSGELLFCPHANSVGGTRIRFIRESDVYRLIMHSKLPDAERFQDWVCEEVLPSIRKHGAYMTDDTLEKALLSPEFLLKLATNLKEEKDKRELAEAEAEKMKEIASKNYGNSIAISKRYLEEISEYKIEIENLKDEHKTQLAEKDKKFDELYEVAYDVETDLLNAQEEMSKTKQVIKSLKAELEEYRLQSLGIESRPRKIRRTSSVKKEEDASKKPEFDPSDWKDTYDKGNYC